MGWPRLILVVLASATIGASGEMSEEEVPPRIRRYASALGIGDLRVSRKPREGTLASFEGLVPDEGWIRRVRPEWKSGERMVVAVLPSGRLLLAPVRVLDRDRRDRILNPGLVETGQWWSFLAEDLGLAPDHSLSRQAPLGSGFPSPGHPVTGVIRDPGALIEAGIRNARAGLRFELARPEGDDESWRLRLYEVSVSAVPRDEKLTRGQDLSYLQRELSETYGLGTQPQESRHARYLMHRSHRSGRDMLCISVVDADRLHRKADLAAFRFAAKGDILHADLELLEPRAWCIRKLMLLRLLPDHPTAVHVRLEDDGCVRAHAEREGDPSDR